MHLLAWCPIAFSLREPHWDGDYQGRKTCRENQMEVTDETVKTKTRCGQSTEGPPQPRHRKRLRMMRFLRRPVTAMYDCHASVRTQQNEDRKKKWRNAAIMVHKTWNNRGIQEEDQVNRIINGWAQRDSTLFQVCVCPMRIRALEEMMERQKLMRMTERSDRMYLQQKWTKDNWRHEWKHHLPASAATHTSVSDFSKHVLGGVGGWWSTPPDPHGGNMIDNRLLQADVGPQERGAVGYLPPWHEGLQIVPGYWPDRAVLVTLLWTYLCSPEKSSSNSRVFIKGELETLRSSLSMQLTRGTCSHLHTDT